MWRKLRIGILLTVLAAVAWASAYDHFSTTDWDETLTIGVYPVDDPDDAVIHAFVGKLTDDDVVDIETFLNDEAAEYGVSIERPVSVALFKPVAESPPERNPESGLFGNIWWSLKMRLYAGRAARANGEDLPQIRIFVRFHDPDSTSVMPHSLGLQKGLAGVVHAFADPSMRGSNNVVIAHEILHTLGATDKYDLRTLEPLFPIGYADPQRQPRLPQEFAEIMAGRIPIRAGESEIPESLDEVVVGAATAAEIRWVSP